jgi:hypothetical protein
MAEDLSTRRFTRVEFEAEVKLYSAGAMWETSLIDISLMGCLCRRPEGWDGRMDKRYRLELRLPGGSRISMNASAANSDGDAIGFEWSKIDFDSFSNLKRLIELNIGDPELMNREISALG